MSNPPRGYEKEYSETRFRSRLRRYASLAGREVVERALQLFYAAREPGTPRWAKTAIYGALGYFISLADAVPDLTPIVGYTDDLGVLVAALAAVTAHVTPEIRERAAKQAERWFGAAE